MALMPISHACKKDAWPLGTDKVDRAIGKPGFGKRSEMRRRLEHNVRDGCNPRRRACKKQFCPFRERGSGE